MEAGIFFIKAVEKLDYIEKLYRFYLTKKQVDKLTIVRNLVVEKQLSLDAIGESLSKSLYQVKILLTEIDDDLAGISTLEDSFFFLEKRTLHLSDDLNQEQSLYIFVNLKKKYFLESPYYKLLIYLLRKRKTRMVDISEELIFSVSYCYKLLSYLKKMFAVQNVPIKISNSSDSIQLTGEESCIRMYHYLVEVMACNVYTEHPIRSSVEWIAKDYETLRTTKVKHAIVFSIIENAILRGNIVPGVDASTLALYHCLKKENDQQLANLFPIRNQSDVEKELVYYYFWRVLFIPETVRESEKKVIGEKFLMLENNGYVDFASQILEQLSKKYALTKQASSVFIYEVVINTWGYIHLYLDNFLSIGEIDYTNDRLVEVEVIIDRVLNNHRGWIEREPLFIRKLSQIVTSYLPIQKEDQINIGISLLNHPEYIPVIKNTLLKIYNEKVIKFNANLADSDILVSDGVLIHNASQKFAFFGNVHNTRDWDNLNAMIQSAILAKYT